VGSTHESLVERLIREAHERGEFDDLPLHGKPIPLQENPWEGEMALAYTVLKNAAVAPPWIEADKEARSLSEARDRLLERAAHASSPSLGTDLRAIERIVTAYNAAVARLNAAAPTTRQHRRPMVLAEERAALERAHSSSASDQPHGG
jgi:hypothetical protein